MSTPTLDTVLADLQRDGLLGAELPPREQSLTLPWFVRTLLTGAAWLTALLIIFAVGAIGFSVSEESAFLVIGLLFAGFGVFLMRASGMPFFIEQFAVPFALAGGGLSIFGILAFDHSWSDDNTVAVVTIIVSAILYAAGRGMTLRLVGAGVAWGMIYWMTVPSWHRYDYDGAGSISHMLWVEHLRNLTIGAGVWALWRFDDELRARRLHDWLFPLTLVLTITWVVISALEDPFVRLYWSNLEGINQQAHLGIHELVFSLPMLLWLGERIQARDFSLPDVLPLFLAIPVAALSGILAAGYALLLFGMQSGRRSLMAFGVAVSVAGFGWFYYNLVWPLWLKSLVLMVAGGLLLVVGRQRRRSGQGVA